MLRAGVRKASRSPTVRSRTSNRPHALEGVDGRTRLGRRYHDLVSGYLDRLGNPTDDVTLSAVRRAAELTLAAEEARARAVRGEPVDVGELVRLENLAARAVRALGIESKQRPARVPLRERIGTTP